MRAALLCALLGIAVAAAACTQVLGIEEIGSNAGAPSLPDGATPDAADGGAE